MSTVLVAAPCPVAAAEAGSLSGTVSAAYCSGVVHFAVGCGANMSDLFAAVGLHADDLAEQERRLPLDTLRRLFSACARVLDDEAFALRFGLGVPCGQLTLAAALAASRPPAPSDPLASANTASAPQTLRDALTGLNRYASLGVDFGAYMPRERYRFVEDATGVWLEDCRPHVGPFAWPALTESVFARFATGIRRRGGESIVRALEVTHARPQGADHRAAYEAIFRAPITFSAGRNAICLDPHFLELPLEPLAAPVQEVLTRHADALVQRVRQQGSWRQRVEEVLVAHLRNDTSQRLSLAGLTVVCRELAVSRQTLHRRLRLEGTTFAALHDAARQQLADALLRRDGLPVAVVAFRLGFSEPAAFSRAYKRWTGQRPSHALRAG
jgi:AraC-like DNA-binding protein